jgi:hypothetical protein
MYTHVHGATAREVLSFSIQCNLRDGPTNSRPIADLLRQLRSGGLIVSGQNPAQLCSIGCVLFTDRVCLASTGMNYHGRRDYFGCARRMNYLGWRNYFGCAAARTIFGRATISAAPARTSSFRHIR